jgi:hypothetical protein
VVIAGTELGRVVGYGEDEDDCYFIVQHMRPKGAVWHSCVGGFYSLELLRGQGYVRSSEGEDWDDYVRLDTVLSLNGAPKAETFTRYVRSGETTSEMAETQA